MTTNLNPLDVNSDGVVPELPIPPYQGTPFLLARDGRTPLALAGGYGTWPQWLPVTGR
jgi:hypothetical protein